jgi:hypothetical protein
MGLGLSKNDTYIDYNNNKISEASTIKTLTMLTENFNPVDDYTYDVVNDGDSFRFQMKGGSKKISPEYERAAKLLGLTQKNENDSQASQSDEYPGRHHLYSMHRFAKILQGGNIEVLNEQSDFDNNSVESLKSISNLSDDYLDMNGFRNELISRYAKNDAGFSPVSNQLSDSMSATSPVFSKFNNQSNDQSNNQFDGGDSLSATSPNISKYNNIQLSENLHGGDSLSATSPNISKYNNIQLSENLHGGDSLSATSPNISKYNGVQLSNNQFTNTVDSLSATSRGYAEFKNNNNVVMAGGRKSLSRDDDFNIDDYDDEINDVFEDEDDGDRNGDILNDREDDEAIKSLNEEITNSSSYSSTSTPMFVSLSGGSNYSDTSNLEVSNSYNPNDIDYVKYNNDSDTEYSFREPNTKNRFD